MNLKHLIFSFFEDSHFLVYENLHIILYGEKIEIEAWAKRHYLGELFIVCTGQLRDLNFAEGEYLICSGVRPDLTDNVPPGQKPLILKF